MKITSDQFAPAQVRLVSEHEAALRLSLGRRTLQEMRLAGTGPAYIELGTRRIAYDLRDLEIWIAARRVSRPVAPTSTPEDPAK